MTEPKPTRFINPRSHAETVGGKDETLPASLPSPVDPVGQILAGRYRVDRHLGSGGMGAVYVGHHLTLNVPIAIKLMHPAVATYGQNAARFQREAHAMSVLQHRNVVRVLDFGEANGRFFIAMEFLKGRTLDGRLSDQTNRMTLDELGPILEQVLLALDAAHQMGIVHRDVKPDNIFLMEEPGGETVVKVVDFGLAHMEVAQGEENLTMADALAGTPSYMSPEQCRSLQVGPSTDLYAVGCVLTEMLQGTPPFSAPSAMEVMARHLYASPPPIAKNLAGEVVPELLEQLRLDLLAKKEAQRPSSAREVIRRLKLALDPAAHESALPGRQSGGKMPREDRAPTWDALSRKSLPPVPGASIAIVRLTGANEVNEESALAMQSQGIEVVAEDAAAAIILDGGSDFAGAEKFLRERPLEKKRIPIIACMKNGGAEQLGALIAAGASDFLAYPILPDALSKRVMRAIRRKR